MTNRERLNEFKKTYCEYALKNESKFLERSIVLLESSVILQCIIRLECIMLEQGEITIDEITC